MRRTIRKNNSNILLYEKIIHTVDKCIRKTLNESGITNNLPVIRTEKDVRLLNKKDFVRRYKRNCRSIKFNIDLSYIFPDGDWTNPIVQVEYYYLHYANHPEDDLNYIDFDYSDDELEINGYSQEELENYLMSNHATWVYDYLDL